MEIDTHIQSTDIIKDILCQGCFEGYIGIMLERDFGGQLFTSFLTHEEQSR